MLSSKQFGFIVRDGKGNPLKNVKVHAACSGTPTLNQNAWTSEDGLVTFLTKDFDPDEDNRVVINVVLTKDYYCTREMRNLTIRGGSAEPVALELGATCPRRGVHPLDTAKYILAARKALEGDVWG